MTLFWLAAALLVAAVLGVLLRPLMRAPHREADPRETVRMMYRRQLDELEAERVQGRIDPEAAAANRAEITRRLLAEAEADRGTAGAGAAQREFSWRIGAAVGIAGLLPAAALAIYFMLGTPAALQGTPAMAGHDAAELAQAVAQLKRRLERNPDDVEGWALLGRTAAALGHVAEARDAFRHAAALAPGDPELHAQLGEMLVLAAAGKVTPEAETEFKKSPEDPRSRFYEAEGAVQRGDTKAAKAGLEALLRDTPAEAPWRKIVVARLAQLAPDAATPPAAATQAEASPPAAGMPGPSPEQAAAAAKMPPADQLQMIRGMVGRLAARLQADPADTKGWLMLARSYRVLGRNADAVAALKQANDKVPGNLDLLKAYMDALAGEAGGAELSPQLVSLASRVNALDGDEPEALWYLGVAAAQKGDKAAATRYWQHLLAELPKDDDKRAMVQQHLDALR